MNLSGSLLEVSYQKACKFIGNKGLKFCFRPLTPATRLNFPLVDLSLKTCKPLYSRQLSIKEPHPHFENGAFLCLEVFWKERLCMK